jgi:hypothetical protein
VTAQRRVSSLHGSQSRYGVPLCDGTRKPDFWSEMVQRFAFSIIPSRNRRGTGQRERKKPRSLAAAFGCGVDSEQGGRIGLPPAIKRSIPVLTQGAPYLPRMPVPRCATGAGRAWRWDDSSGDPRRVTLRCRSRSACGRREARESGLSLKG